MSSNSSMRAYLIFTGSSPILILSTYPQLSDERLVDKLRYKGIDKFIAYEVHLDAVRLVAAHGRVLRALLGAARLPPREEVRV